MYFETGIFYLRVFPLRKNLETIKQPFKEHFPLKYIDIAE